MLRLVAELGRITDEAALGILTNPGTRLAFATAGRDIWRMQNIRIAAVSMNSELGKRAETRRRIEQYCEQAEADVAVFALEEGDFQFVDALKKSRIGHRKLLPVATIKAGRIYGSASMAVEG